MGFVILIIALALIGYFGWRFAPDHLKVMVITKWGALVSSAMEAATWLIPLALAALEQPELEDLANDYLPPKFVALGFSALIWFFRWARTKTIAPVGGTDPNENV